MNNIPHCKPGEDCTCSEKDETLIEKLFYEMYSDQFKPHGGQVIDGIICLYYYNPINDILLAATLDKPTKTTLVVKEI